MNLASESLSSPCGYYGELILQHIRSPIAAAVMATEQMIAPKERKSGFRSHFNGLRIIEQQGRWCCEARVTLPNMRATTHTWLPFAELQVANAEERPKSQSALLIPQYSEPPSTPKREDAKAKYEDSRKELAASSKKVTKKIRGYLPLKWPADFDPSELELHYGMNSSEPNRAMSDWLSKNDMKLSQLRAADVDDLLKDLAVHLASTYSKISHKATARRPSIEVFMEDCADAFKFLARVFRLHWYLGHDDWRGILDTIDGGYPRSRAPSQAWAANVKSEACDYPELEAASLGRAWLWPWLYQRICKIDQEFDSTVFFADHSYIKAIAFQSRYAIGSLGEWWTMLEHDACHIPYLVRRSVTEHQDCEYGFCEAILEYGIEDWSIAGEHYNCERYLTAEWFHRVEEYKELVFDAPSWDVEHQRAFPSIGDDLTIDELLRRDRLGFALRRFETETEGDKAWERLVKNAVFDDALGLRAIASKVSEHAESSLYAHFGPSRHVHRFQRKSDSIQILLHQFVKATLLEWHGDQWCDVGIPSKVLEPILARKPKADSIDELLREVLLLDYMRILIHPPNWTRFESFVTRVGKEPPNKKAFKDMIKSWNIARNRAAHVEKNESISREDIADLDEPKRCIIMWLYFLGPDA